MNIGSVLWLVPILPALGALINGVRAVMNPDQPKNRVITNSVAVGSTALSALIATAVLLTYISHGTGTPFEVVYYNWIPSGSGHVAGNLLANFNVELGFQIDALSGTMLMIVTWIGLLIHIYATGYMAHESGYTRFFTYLNLFMFMMLLLVLGNNYLVMFVGWEGVGLCSYLLIGFYYDKTYAADAGKKAFLTNRIGDFGFILGIFLIFNYFGTSDFTSVFSLAAAEPGRFTGIATAICLLLFVGACGKSAQLPLYVWLPDAMAGPTPVSALIHAATMVTAGVYMVVRSNVLFRLSPTAMLVVAVVGAATAIFAATIGVAQNDIKKVLAYSTVSQLGFMFLAAGVGAFTAAIFHVMTHAFFKACLFLGSGSVIHGCGGEQDMRKMGGLRRYMPKTWATFLVATIAIAGLPPLAGFFSKDEILAGAFIKRFDSLGAPLMYVPILCWIAGMIAATFTAFYMFRLYYMTFEGSYRGAAGGHGEESEPAHAGHDLISDSVSLDDAHAGAGVASHAAHGTPHESPISMTGVLMVLALLSVVGGWIGIPFAAFGIEGPNPFQHWLEPILLPIGGEHYHFPHASLALDWFLILASVAVALFGIWLARRFYGLDKSWSRPRALANRFPFVHRLLENKYYVDELYQAVVIRPLMLFSRLLAWIDTNIIDGVVNGIRHLTVIILGHGSWLFDRFIVDGAVNGVAAGAGKGSGLLRRLQSGMVQNYAMVMGAGIVLLAAVFLFLKP
ncbi:MAG TPA: NADH-quinone oxidoreductase subunit L [Thermoanaerobaculia bacterium]|nr:NADH-quinone oxidoreductase subunit L [Thermoanaerobaculia bacterium]